MPTDSYARISNPRLLVVVRVGLIIVFTFMTVAGLLSIPANFQENRNFITAIPDLVHSLSNLGMSVDAGATYNFALLLVQDLLFSAAGFIIFLYRSDDWLAILTSCIFVGNGIAGLIYAHSGFPILGLLVVLHVIVAVLPIFPFLCLFPDGRFLPRWSRWLIPICTVLCLPLIYRNYLYWVYNIDVGEANGIGALLLVFWTIGTGFLLLRLRRAKVAVQRQQIKQVFGGMLAVIGALSISILSASLPMLAANALLNVIIVPLLSSIGSIFLVLAITLAILRYGLWEIDLVLNRSIVYFGMVIVLGLVFLAILLVLQAGLQAALGSQQTTIAAMISAGAVAALFNPARLRLQHLVDRQIFGLRVDLSKVSKAEQQPDIKLGRRDTSNLIGKQLGPYEVSDLIGRGGMGEVYLANQPSLGRQVAIKILPRHLSTDPEFLARFEREARIVANLHHPNIINVFDFGEIDGLYCMVMEYIQGQGLDGLLRERKVLPLEEAQPLITQVADALDYAHGQGIIHRDIKPSNIMLRYVSNPPNRLHAILMDFGLTKLADSESGLTQGNDILGTLAYTAPEQITASGKVDHRADIYAFGVMCYEMLTGKQPFVERNQAALLFAHLQRPAPDPRTINPDLSPEAASAILQALDKTPDNRPQSTGAFAAQLSSAVLSKA